MPKRLIVPEEHGAWGELLFPLASGLIAGQPGAEAWLVAVAALGGFLVSGSVQVLIGWRGTRALRDRRGDATFSLWIFGGVALPAAILAFSSSTPGTRGAMLASAGLAGMVWMTARAGRLKTTPGEVLASVALVSWVVPVALSAGASVWAAIGLLALWSATFVSATLAVRSVIARQTRADDRGLRAGAVTLAAATLGMLGWLIVRKVTPLVVGFGFLPVACLVLVVAGTRMVPARRLRWIGWSLVAASGLLLVALAWV